MSLALLTPTSRARAETVHTVAAGQTIGKIAKRYNVSIEALCTANHMTRRDRIKPGQQLTIPERQPKREQSETLAVVKSALSETEPRPSAAHTSVGMQILELGVLGPAYYFEPSGPGRRSLRPVLIYLHGRGGHPAEDCRRWAPIARRMGWLVCPSGPEMMGDGRGWNNNWLAAQRVALSAVQALRERFGRRVQLYGNTLIGFSEGAYAAMNVGVREPRTFNRWLILAGDVKYWGAPGLSALHESRGTLRRVYLITGEQDEVLSGTHTAREWLEQAGVATHLAAPRGVGHEVALQRRPALYRAALTWLAKGSNKEKPRDAVAKNE